MSVTFYAPKLPVLLREIEGEQLPYSPGEFNLSNMNARGFLDFIGVPANEELYGSMPARDLLPLCRRALWPELASRDEGTPTVETGNVILCGRPAGYLQTRAAQLLELCELAGDTEISWG